MSDAYRLIFFDESGKKEDHPILMGAVSVPREIYNREDFVEKMGSKIHWSEFKKKELMMEILNLISNYQQVVRINIINYDYTAIEKAAASLFGEIDRKEFIARTLYAKFPERIFYGLLRNNVKHVMTQADIIIEKATEYQHYVTDLVEKELNVQALYRAEKFRVNSCTQKEKGVEVGLEITDLILGIVRLIIKKCTCRKSE